MDYNRKRDLIIDAVMNRWPEAPYRLREQAGDAAIKALEDGKSLRECVEVAKSVVDPKLTGA